MLRDRGSNSWTTLSRILKETMGHSQVQSAAHSNSGGYIPH
jgi:hypothetical protein